MKQYFVLALFYWLTVPAAAQIVSVVDEESGKPVEYAKILNLSEKRQFFADERGQADIPGFADDDSVLFGAVGYETKILTYSQIKELNFVARLAPSAVSFDEVVVSANKWKQSKRETPFKIASISKNAVEFENPRTAADLLEISGESFVQKSQLGGGSPMIRGFATNRLLISVDGVRMNTAIFRSGNIQNVISLDPFAIESAEILFGPGSVIYGSDAIGGVMSFYTKTPQFSESGETSGAAAVRASSASGEATGHIDVNVGWSDFAMTSSLSHFRFGDLRMGTNGPDEYLRDFRSARIDGEDVVISSDEPLVQNPTRYSQSAFMQKFRYKPDETWDMTYALHYSETSDYDRYDRLIRTREGLPRSAVWKYGPQIWSMNMMEISNSGENALYEEATLRAAYQYFEESRIDRGFGDSRLRTRTEKVRAYSLNLDAKKSLGKSDLYYGIEGVFDEVDSKGVAEDVETGETRPYASRYPQSSWSSLAAYLSYKYKFSESFIAQAGARYNQISLNADFDTTFYPLPFTKADLSDGALTGVLGFAYFPDKSWNISANVSTGFRSPNVDDVGKIFDSEPGSVVVPNTALKSEYAYNADLGVAKVFGEYVKIDLTAFYATLNDAMVRRDFVFDGRDSIVYDGELSRVQAVQNAAQARVYGLQAGIEIKTPRDFAFSARYNFQKGEEELDDGSTSPSRHAAPDFGTVRATYSASPVKMEFYILFNGEISNNNLAEEEKGKPYLYAKNADGEPYSPSWQTYNFKASARLGRQTRLVAGVENIGDLRYRPYSSGIAAPGRNFFVSFIAEF